MFIYSSKTESSNFEQDDDNYLLDAPLTPGYLIYLARSELDSRAKLGIYNDVRNAEQPELVNQLINKIYNS